MLGLVWLVEFLATSSTTRLYRGQAPRQSVGQFYVLPHMRQSWETMTSVSAGHIILTPRYIMQSGMTVAAAVRTSSIALKWMTNTAAAIKIKTTARETA